MNREATFLLQAWQRQLVREHQNLCHYYRIALPTPLFEIGHGNSRAGSWRPDPEPGIITIAANLIREQSWDLVLEVLKHEICHQYVSHYFPTPQEAPHGPNFQRACQLLGVHPALRRAQGELPPPTAATSPAPPITVRVEKLLALAASANEHEAALAMAKAGELMRKHNLQRLSPAADPPPLDHYDYLVIDSGRQRRAAHHNHLAAILSDFFYVKTVSYQLYQPTADRQHRVLELLGSKENLVVAEHVYHFLEKQLERLWADFRQTNPGRVSGRERNSYYLGILNGLREKLRGQEQGAAKQTRTTGAGAAAPPTCSQLICAADGGLRRFHDQRYPRLRRSRGRGVRLYDSSYRAGKEEGRRLTIHQVVRQPPSNRGRLLG
ncbi:SprT-like domain-containing protein [Desulfurivibrio sp. D14AmB]|uniref:SprT-like domain-containing protein n=1 Tax=Desulfurivibrio sp. D14AmB TaxID=3374370 RepID=UPI00376EAFD9